MSETNNVFKTKALVFLEGLGGENNIESVTNCATRLRVNVRDPEKVLDDNYFMGNEAIGVVRKKNNIQVIVGTSVSQVRDEFDRLLQ
ncbi:hypothetical protein WJ7_08330 [Tetragenococcus halophilus]|nr:hypothetical protein WJ7_08330 [Tetragenococcus halophilus]